ncbi:hypothetical protein C2845_PMPSC011931 [Panicum miliaceum]|uniref:Dienelactone hydrolase domain-containing protein n=1 Tax=Panicum miliaceum TaxID=4540 RepID=A0A3L6PC86_PANMI|nr:hypothetical protein C2845_PMPSC011931 [Panicum miliaceum]
MASPDCFENPPALDPACGGGEVVDDFGGKKAYVAGSAEAKVAVVLVSDAFGFEAPKLRYLLEKAFEEAKPVIAALNEKGMSTIGAAGYCWGAKVVAELAKAREIQAAVMSHPSLVTVDDIKELVKRFKQVLSANSAVAHFVKIFPGVTHGWAVRYSDDDEAAVKSAEEAFADMTGWFDKHLK